jgi:NAD(P)-dependent dehydrogenase (short-subunit alcohol dehydrogenase family)
MNPQTKPTAAKVALVTGGSRGIGFGIADRLAAEGWDVLINGIRPEEAVAEALAALRKHGRRVAYACGDVAAAEGRAAILAAARAFAGGAINLLVNNAGVAPSVRLDLLETTEASFDRVVGTNLRGAFFLTQSFAREMVAARRAHAAFTAAIITITSVSATAVSVNRAEYCIAKAGLSMMSQLFAARLGADGIPVYDVRPGIIRTDMTAGVVEKYDRLIAGGLCIQPRWGLPEEVGQAVACLARGDLPYSTGQVIMVDGGLALPRL